MAELTQLSGTLSNSSPVLSGTISNTSTISGNLSSASEKLSGALSNLGIRGYSAYDLAVKNGFKGTEEEWLESLKGSQILLRKNENCLEWKYEEDTEWHFLMDLNKDYEELYDKPKINSVELIGDMDLKTLGIQEKGDYANKNELPDKISNIEIENILKLGGLL